jgi:FixJ family two-component response regulator
MTICKAPLLAVVDDFAEVRIALARLVSSAGFEVEAFESGAAFLQSLDDHEPDCVLLDLHMPGTNGFDVQRAMAPAHAGVPVIVITGHDSSESRARALSGGAKGYLCKPVDGETLLEAIAAAIATRRAQAGWRRP